MKTIGVILTDGFEELEAISVIDILRRATCNVEVISLSDSNVTGAHRITLIADDIFDYYSSLDFDGIIFVGGMTNANLLSQEQKIIDLINHYNDENKFIAGICATSAIVFSKTNLKDRKMTCYPSENLMNYVANFVDEKVVVDDNLITSQSPSTAYEFALACVNYLGYDDASLRSEMRGGD